MQHRVKFYFAEFKKAHPAYFILLSSSSIILISSMLINFLNFLFHLVAARNLSVDDYGIFQTMLNLFNIITFLTVFVNTQITRQLTKYISKGNNFSASALVNKSNLGVAIIGLIILILFILINSITPIELGSVTSQNLAIVIILSILGYFLTINRALMRAHLLFTTFALNSNLHSVLKIIISVPLFFLGFKLSGVIFSLFLSSLLALLYSVWQLRGRFFLNVFEKIDFNVKNFMRESASTMIGVLGLTSLISTDLILTQHYLFQQAGYYAGLSLFGKGIILTTFPLSSVLFPFIISTKSNIVSNKLFKIAILGVFAIGISIFLVYLLIPKQIVSLVLSPSYLSIVPLLPYYSLSVFLYSISHIIVYGFTALEEYTPGYIVFLAAILQIIGILFFHDKLENIVTVSLLINIGLIVYLTIFTKFKLHAITKRYYDNKQLSVEGGISDKS